MSPDMVRRYKIPLLLGGVSIFCIAVACALFVRMQTAAEPIQFSTDMPIVAGDATGSAQFSITVDVEGAVVHPGVYHIPQGSRVQDAIDAAGGTTPVADTDRISRDVNRAAVISDGAKLYIPKKTDAQQTTAVSDVGSASVPLGTVSLNGASQSQLEALSGIGPATATKIIAGRPYQRLDEVVAKKAMSQSLLDKLRSQLSL